MGILELRIGEKGILDRRVGLFLRNLASPSDLSCISFEIVIPSPFQVVGLFLVTNQ